MIARHRTRNSRTAPRPGDVYEDFINPCTSGIILVLSSEPGLFGDHAIVGIDLLSAQWDVTVKRAVSFVDWERISIGSEP